MWGGPQAVESRQLVLSDAPDTPETVVRLAGGSGRAEEWVLVLVSAGIECRVDRTPEGWAVLVGAADAERAAAAIDAYERENRPAPVVPEPPAVDHGGKWTGVVMGALLVLAFRLTGGRLEPSAAFEAGTAHARRILDGEWWRTVTALTLHSDASHLMSNLIAGVFLATAVCRTVGPGLGAWLILISGAGGNALNAILRGPPHVSVGASTAVLGAVGVLSGLATVRVVREGRRLGRAWIPFAAGIALLAMLGSSETSDLGAHFFGFVAGGVAGAVAAFLPVPGPAAQRVLAALALVVVPIAWLLALR
jgi:rhomboid protease GluP